MNIRLLDKKELDKAENLWDYCFDRRGDTFFSWYFSDYCRTDRVLGAFCGEHLAGMVHLNPYVLALSGRNIAVSYLVGVAVAPEYRQRGLFARLLKAAFTVLRDRGQSLVILMPMAAGLYLPHDFSYCYNKLVYKLPITALRRLFLPGGYEFSSADSRDWPILGNLYREFVRTRNGYTVRERREWRDTLGGLLEGDRGKAVIVKKGGQPQGYLFYVLKNRLFQAIELIWLEEAAKGALLNFAAQHASQAEELSWLAPPDDLTFLRFKSDGYYPVMRPFMMSRVINPERLLASLNLPLAKGGFYIRIEDRVLEENNRVFYLGSRREKAYLKPSDGCAADAVMSVGTFAQLCLGAYDAEELKAAAYIETENGDVLNLLASLFPKRNNYINEQV
jgi:predicted acetyltransferase